jgi:hypothetical protein
MAKTLALDIPTRVNVRLILESREGRNAADYRMLIKLIDKLDLTKEEKDRVKYREIVAGDGALSRTIPVWGGPDVPEQNFTVDIELEDAEYERLREIFSGPVRGVVPQMRDWLLPLLDQLKL